MDKRKPTHDLINFQVAMSAKLEMTVTALRGALQLCGTREEIKAVIRCMRPAHFYKSTTSNNNHREWQDVYHVPYEGVTVYVKFRDDVIS